MDAALRVAVDGFAAQELPLRLRAGAPHTFTLLDGHPWEAQARAAPCASARLAPFRPGLPCMHRLLCAPARPSAWSGPKQGLPRPRAATTACWACGGQAALVAQFAGALSAGTVRSLLELGPHGLLLCAAVTVPAVRMTLCSYHSKSLTLFKGGRLPAAQMRAAAESLTQLPSGRPAAVATLTVGAELPAFTACARDAWGNASGPAPALTCELLLECAALEPASLAVPFSAAGVARVQGAPCLALTLTPYSMCIAHGWERPGALGLGCASP